MAHPPRAGALNRRVTIQQGIPSSTSEGDALLTWTPVGDVWASVQPASARELQLAAQRAEEITHTVIIRYQPQFFPPEDLRIVWGNRTLAVVAATDPDEGHKALILRCKEYVVGSAQGAV